MSQYSFTNIDPVTTSGTDLADLITQLKNALLSQHKGAAAPSYVTAGLTWIDDSASPWKINFYDGTNSIVLGTINPTTHVFTPFGVTPKVQTETVASAPKSTFTITGGYRAGAMKVYQNGLRLMPSDYTASNGTTVVLGTNAAVGDDMFFEFFD